jgi:hypothetical protein
VSSRREQKEALKAERLEREAQAKAAERRKRLVGYGAGGALVVAAVIALVVVLVAGGGSDSAGGVTPPGSGELPEGTVPPVEIGDLDEAVKASGCKVTQDDEEGSEHVPDGTEVQYRANPPTSGDHWPVPAEDGAYTEPPPKEALVHSQEHGRIVIQYDPEAPESVIADLTALFEEDPYHMIITPNETDMPFEVAATTWTRTLGCEEMNDQVFDAIRAFKDEYRDQGPEFVP